MKRKLWEGCVNPQLPHTKKKHLVCVAIIEEISDQVILYSLSLNNQSLIHNRTMHFSFSLSLDHSKNTFWPTCKSSNQIDPSLNFYYIKLKKKKGKLHVLPYCMPFKHEITFWFILWHLPCGLFTRSFCYL